MSNSSMKSIVIGAGRLGSNIAKMLSKEKNDVILIDRNREKLGNVVDFTGFLESGDATDLGLLEECGIKDADRLVACTDDDNTNIFISDVCCYIYSVPEVYIRLKDSRKMKVVDDRVKCICPFDLSLEDFAEQKRGE
ncbi:MAG: TrkA family potassium uptake protein [Erysipelotrichaceae bacterium]|nr:TrkA family potassium uptake protein [Erysipelotrichaceae bacterium]